MKEKKKKVKQRDKFISYAQREELDKRIHLKVLGFA